MKNQIEKYQEKFKAEELSLLKVKNIQNLIDAPEILIKLVEDNPFISPNSENIKEAEKNRIALGHGTTDVNKHLKVIKSELNGAKGCIVDIAEKLIEIVKVPELKQETANQKYFQSEAFEYAKEENTRESLEKYLKDYSSTRKTPIFKEEVHQLLNSIEEKEIEELNFLSNFKSEKIQELDDCENSEELKLFILMLEEIDFNIFVSKEDSARSFVDNQLDVTDKRLILFEDREANTIIQAQKDKELAELKEKQAKEDEKRKKDLENANFEIFKSKVELLSYKINDTKTSEHCNQITEVLKNNIRDYGQHQDCKVIITEISAKITTRKYELSKTEKELQEIEEKKLINLQEEKANINGKFKALIYQASEATEENLAEVEKLISETKLESSNEEMQRLINSKKVYCESLLFQVKEKIAEEKAKIAEEKAKKEAKELEEKEISDLKAEGKIKIHDVIFELSTINNIVDYFDLNSTYFLNVDTINNYVQEMNKGRAEGKKTAIDYDNEEKTIQSQVQKSIFNLIKSCGSLYTEKRKDFVMKMITVEYKRISNECFESPK